MSETTKKGFHEKFIEIQALLKAPKDKFNKFGKYSYRSAESIVEAVKPLAHERGLYLKTSEKLVSVADKVYIESTSVISDGFIEETAVAYAREADTQAGMSASQCTGSSSSYAKKYSLSNLFCIDDNQDADATNTHGKEGVQESEPKAPLKESNPEGLVKPSGKEQLTEGHPKAQGAINAVNKGTYTIDQVKAKYDVSPEVLAKMNPPKK